MTKKYLFTVLGTLLTLTFLAACSSSHFSQFKKEEAKTSRMAQKEKVEESSNQKEKSKSSDTASSSSDKSSSTESSADIERTVDGLPENADVAPKDKIYATGNAKVYYVKYADGFEAQIPEFQGYTKDRVKEILGEPESETADPDELQKNLKEKELENLKSLYQSGSLTGEQAHAFYLGANDFAQASRLGEQYTLYSYKGGSVLAVFEGESLSYITPQPDVLYFK